MIEWSKQIRRVARGLCDKPRTGSLTGKPTNLDPRTVIDALSRRDQTCMLIDGITAANDLGLTDAVPAHIVVHTDARLKPFELGNLVIDSRKTAPSKLYWAGRPAMRVVQALHWLQDMLPQDGGRIRAQLRAIFDDPDHGAAIVEDLRGGIRTQFQLGHTAICGRLKPRHLPKAQITLGRQSARGKNMHLVALADGPAGKFNAFGAMALKVETERPASRETLNSRSNSDPNVGSFAFACAIRSVSRDKQHYSPRNSPTHDLARCGLTALCKRLARPSIKVGIFINFMSRKRPLSNDAK